MASSLVTVEDFAAYLKRPVDAIDTRTAQLLLNGACELVVEYCGWHIAPVVSETVGVDGTGTLIQTLPTLNLISLDSVVENGISLNVNRIDWSANGVMEKHSGEAWTRRRRGVVASITHGYPVTPGWVSTLIFAVAGRAMVTPLGVQQETAGGETIVYAVPRNATAGVTTPGTVVLAPAETRMLDRIALPRPA